LSSYVIYIRLNNDEIISVDELYDVLKFPRKIPALGQDDEIIKISSVGQLGLEKINSKSIDSFFAEKENVKWRSFISQKEKIVISPYSSLQPTSFDVNYSANSRSIRKPVNFKRIVEWLNCNIEFEKQIECYSDGKYNILFY